MILRYLQFLWLFPATIVVWFFYIVPLLLFSKSVRFQRWNSWSLIVELSISPDGTWYSKFWRDWMGWSGPCVFICKRVSSTVVYERIKNHEVTHCNQQFRWGVFFYPAYMIASLWILLFRRTKHSYYDNPFERDARKEAGQRVDIPPSQWGDGPSDRWIWW